VLRDQSGLKNQSGRARLGSALALINAVLLPIANIVVNTIGSVAVGQGNVRAAAGGGARARARRMPLLFVRLNDRADGVDATCGLMMIMVGHAIMGPSGR